MQPSLRSRSEGSSVGMVALMLESLGVTNTEVHDEKDGLSLDSVRELNLKRSAGPRLSPV